MRLFHLAGWRKRDFLCIIGFFILPLFPLLFLSQAHGGEPVKIGLLTLSQESDVESGKPYLRGAEMAVAEVNAREGKQGLQLILLLRGGHLIQGKDLRQLRDLIFEERLHFLVGELWKEVIPQISRLAQQQRVPFLVFPNNFMEAASTGEEPATLFWISPSPEAFQRAAVRTAAQFPQKRYYLLSRDSGAGRSWAKYFWEDLKRLKPAAQSVGEFFLPDEVPDYNPFIRAILSAKAEVCISHLGVKEWLRFAKMANKKPRYFQRIIHFELESGSLQALMALKKDGPEGVWGVSAFPFWDLDWKESKEFVAKYREKTKTYPGLDALSGYVTIYAIVEAVKKAGSLDMEKVIETLEGLTFPTPVGQLSLRKADHRALWPIWCGSSRFIPGYPFAVLEELKAFGPDSFSPNPAN